NISILNNNNNINNNCNSNGLNVSHRHITIKSFHSSHIKSPTIADIANIIPTNQSNNHITTQTTNITTRRHTAMAKTSRLDPRCHHPTLTITRLHHPKHQYQTIKVMDKVWAVWAKERVKHGDPTSDCPQQTWTTPSHQEGIYPIRRPPRV
ncbi:hypothetical protein BGZ52_006184, partial [Haplosporangium bisporale]